MRIENARALWVDEVAGAVIAVQESLRLPEEAAFVRLIAVDASGQATAEAYLGPEAFACDTRRPFARLTDGSVVSLAFRDGGELGLDVLPFVPFGTATPKVVGQRPGSSLISEEDDTSAALERLNGTPSVSEIALTLIGRGHILERARAALEIRWSLSPKNYSDPAVPNLCNPVENVWRRPPRLNGLVGKEVVGVPDRWGGYVSTLDVFRVHLNEGRLAGSDCTCRNANCVHPRATGQDCSGFVSYAWQLGNYFTTARLPSQTISTPVLWAELNPGDIVNKVRSHVRLVEGISNGPSGRYVTVIESASNISCGGVCRRSYLESELRQSGYKPLRRLALMN